MRRREAFKLAEWRDIAFDPDYTRDHIDHETNPYLRDKWEALYYQAHSLQKRRGTDRTDSMYRRFNKQEEPVSTEIIPGKSYTNAEMTAIADQLLRDDSHAEMCPECGERGQKTGESETITEGIEDGSGNELALKFDEYTCDGGHSWYPGEGKERGIGGNNPILFEEHFQSRKRREIYTAQGTPDPSIVSGMYNRVHPQGRKVNSKEQRRKNGASFYR